jgi:hypothetical protein
VRFPPDGIGYVFKQNQVIFAGEKAIAEASARATAAAAPAAAAPKLDSEIVVVNPKVLFINNINNYIYCIFKIMLF